MATTGTGGNGIKRPSLDLKDKPPSEAIIERIQYNDSDFSQNLIGSSDVATIDASFKGVTWIDVNGVEDATTVQKVCQAFNLHPIIIEDILDVDQRPKIVDQDNYIFLEYNVFFKESENFDIKTFQHSIILMKNLVITFQQDASQDFFKPLKAKIQGKQGITRKMGTDYLVFLLLDHAIDNYFTILEGIEDTIDIIEDKVIDSPTQEDITTIQQIKQALIYIRKSVWPMREILNRLETMEPGLITKPLRIYFRNAYDHAIYLVDMIETFRDITSSTFDIYLSGQSNRLNNIVKTLTIISVIFTPLNLIVGFFGMNWFNTPEYNAVPVPFLGLICVMVSMFIIATLLVRVFRKRKWF